MILLESEEHLTGRVTFCCRTWNHTPQWALCTRKSSLSIRNPILYLNKKLSTIRVFLSSTSEIQNNFSSSEVRSRLCRCWHVGQSSHNFIAAQFESSFHCYRPSHRSSQNHEDLHRSIHHTHRCRSLCQRFCFCPCRSGGCNNDSHCEGRASLCTVDVGRGCNGVCCPRSDRCDSNGQGCPRGYSCNQTSESSAGCYPCQRTRPGIGEEEEVNAVEGKDEIGVSSFICGHHLPAMHFLVGCAICKRFCLEKRES